MNPKRRKILAVVALAALVAAWIVASTLVSLRDEERWTRQMLAIDSLVLSPRPNAPALAPADHERLVAELEAAIEAELRAIAACLTTDDGSRAPVTLSFELPRTSPPRLGELSEPTNADRDCVERALDRVDWPNAPQPLALQLRLVSLADAESED